MKKQFLIFSVLVGLTFPSVGLSEEKPNETENFYTITVRKLGALGPAYHPFPPLNLFLDIPLSPTYLNSPRLLSFSIGNNEPVSFDIELTAADLVLESDNLCVVLKEDDFELLQIIIASINAKKRLLCDNIVLSDQIKRCNKGNLFLDITAIQTPEPDKLDWKYEFVPVKIKNSNIENCTKLH